MTAFRIPRIPRTKGSYTWRICPYATNDASNRIPLIERTPHVVTSGRMDLDVRGGHDTVGFVCIDPTCPFYLGAATTQIHMQVRNQKVNMSTGEYTIEYIDVPIPICSGTQFWEK